jgi:hypothetical protein
LNPHLSTNNHLTEEDGKDSRFLYDSDDLFDIIYALITKQEDANDHILMMHPLPTYKLFLKLPSIAELCSRFTQLGGRNSHMGIDDVYPESGSRFLHSRHESGELVVAYGTVLEVREYLKRGAVPSQRARLWRRALCLCASSCSADTLTYESLLQDCHRLDLVVDDMIISDVKITVEDPNYFVFEVITVIYMYRHEPCVRISIDF